LLGSPSEIIKRMGENERGMGERWERFWHNRVVVRIDVKMRRGRLSFI
jgi:hypothetical protein